MILLDTNALVWLDIGHRRSLALKKWGGRLHVSPANFLELQFLLEAERIRLRKGATMEGLVADERWTLDDAPSVPWFSAARDLSWTRDPFDPLLVAHARYRGWRLATADRLLLERLGGSEVLEL